MHHQRLLWNTGCKCARILGLMLFTMLMGASITSAVGVPDVLIKDCPADIGAQPDNQCVALYASEAIYVRNQPDGLANSSHQNPMPGQTNWLYVQLKNIGSGTLRQGTVHVYVIKAGTAPVWPTGWVGNYIGSLLYGDEVGTATVVNLGGGASKTVEIPWTNVPDPANYTYDAHHFCLLARFVSDEDPMVTETADFINNVRNNNNIVWKNISILDCSNPYGALDISNGTDHAIRTKLRFLVAEGSEGLLDLCTLKVDLGPELMARWLEGGGQGEGITYPGQGTVIWITGNDATLNNIRLPKETLHTLVVEVIFPQDISEDLEKLAFRWDIIQMDEDEDKVMGGEVYDIRMKRCRPDVMIRDCNADVGAESNISCGGNYSSSPAIYIRNQQDGLTNAIHQNAIAGQNNWVYVELKNISNRILNNGTVHLYFTKASTGLFWPSSWTGPYPYGDEIGTAYVGNLGPNQSRTVEILWNNVPDPSLFNDPDARHFCLLARLESTEDPMSFTETSSVLYNVSHNNNIAWKNTSIMDCKSTRSALDLYNATQAVMPTTLRFDVGGDGKTEERDHVLNHAGITVDLGPVLFDQWRANGELGEGIGRGGDNEIVIKDPHAWIGGLHLEREVRYTVHPQIAYPADLDADVVGKVFQWDVTQVNQDNGEVIGGENYQFHMKRCGTDVMIRDCIGDVGSEPNLACGGIYSNSPAIYVRNQQDGLTNTTQQTPIAGQDNWVYVQLKNISNQTLGNGTVYLYFTKGSTGGNWPATWNGPYPYGSPIGSVTINNLSPGQTTTAEFLWNNVPDPSQFNDPWASHFCLLARFVSSEDPMTYTEVPSVYTNTQNNNNIAWKNMTVIGCDRPRAPLDIVNDNNAARATLRFDVPEEDEKAGNNVLKYCRIKVDLGAELLARWEEGGGRGEGIRREGEEIWIEGTHANIQGINLAPDTRYTMHVEVVYPEQVSPEATQKVFNWNITHVNETADGIAVVGGETYTINMKCKAEVIIRDCNADAGGEPDLACNGIFWNSPSIYVRNQQDGLTNATHQSPVAGQTNWTYVKVQNLNNATLNSGKVYLYFAKASTGLFWPGSWISQYPYGDLIGTASIDGLAPYATQTVEIKWNNVPDPSWFNDPDARHFCLLARMVSTDDPMTYTEVSSILYNVQYNNNIAWKNTTIVDPVRPYAPLDLVHVPRVQGRPATVRFDVPAEEDQDHALNHCRINVDLDPRVYDIWRAGGSQGEGIEDQDGRLRIASPHAWIGGLQLKEGERYTLHTEVDYSGSEPTDQVYHWMVTQYTEGNDKPIGGEVYDIHMTEWNGKRSTAQKGDLSILMHLTAYPNPANASTTIGYVLPFDADVTLAIYDASGRLVRTLLANDDQKTGRHETEWDGTTTDGTPVANGTYFYRLSTSMGMVENQLKIVR